MGIPSYSNGHVRAQVPLLLPVIQPQKSFILLTPTISTTNFNRTGSHCSMIFEARARRFRKTSPRLAYSDFNRFLHCCTPFPWLGERNSHLWMLLKNRLFKNLGSIGHLSESFIKPEEKNGCPRTTPRSPSRCFVEKREHTVHLV